ncbi:MAG: sodium-coupled permease, partial [Verrucomicrobiales bacterium]
MILLSQTLNTPPPQGLLFVDWSIIALYAGLTIFLGWWYGRSQTSTKEYFVGSGAMNPWLVGVSLFATLLSTITYLSKPGEMLGKGPVVMVDILMYPLVFLVVAFWLLPIYMKHKVTSAYELLENRLGLGIRLLAVGLFLLLRLVWMSLLIYLTAKAITTMCGLDKKWIIAVVIAAGTVSMIYTSLGGMRAVVITDLIQTILLYGGALLVIGTVTWKMGGVSWFPTQWKPHWDHQPFFSFDISTRVTVFGTLLSMFLWFVGTSGSDQVTVQRFMSTKDVSAARRALGMQLGVGALVGLTLSLVGFALLGFFEANPGSLAPGLSLKGNADEIFPYFIAYHLPPVVSGLVVSGLF